MQNTKFKNKRCRPKLLYFYSLLHWPSSDCWRRTAQSVSIQQCGSAIGPRNPSMICGKNLYTFCSELLKIVKNKFIIDDFFHISYMPEQHKNRCAGLATSSDLFLVTVLTPFWRCNYLSQSLVKQTDLELDSETVTMKRGLSACGLLCPGPVRPRQCERLRVGSCQWQVDKLRKFWDGLSKPRDIKC